MQKCAKNMCISYGIWFCSLLSHETSNDCIVCFWCNALHQYHMSTGHLKSLATWLLVQKLLETNKKENITRPHCWLLLDSIHKWPAMHRVSPWASYQIRKIAGCACAENAGNVFPHRRFRRKPLVSDPGMHHGTCVTHVPWCMSGSLTCGGGENVPGIPGACAPAILRIWQEAHAQSFSIPWHHLVVCLWGNV